MCIYIYTHIQTGSPNSKDSVDQDSSAGALLFQCSQSLMVALVLSMTSAVIHILCVSN